jgi:hypothetical protein
MNHPAGNPSGIHCSRSLRTRILNNITGFDGESRQQFGVRTGVDTLAAHVIGNHCKGVRPGPNSFATIIGSAYVPGTCAVWRDNTAASGIALYGGARSRPAPYLPA